ncbi:MAG: hypothetical protein LBV80_00725 [Deltaproteobacteria bacterium]|jgi:hypothetical protein|nr:hypothetical protein [Deltaproteobacteria bacterium]
MMHMTEVLICLNTILLGIVGFFLRRALEKLERLGFHKEECLREFATKEDTTDLFAITRKQGEDIAALKSWNKFAERKP